jgi:hypothetical protein
MASHQGKRGTHKNNLMIHKRFLPSRPAAPIYDTLVKKVVRS